MSLLDALSAQILTAWDHAPDEIPDVEMLKNFMEKIEEAGLASLGVEGDRLTSSPCVVLQGIKSINEFNELGNTLNVPHLVINLEEIFEKSFRHSPGFEHIRDVNETMITAQARAIRTFTTANPPPKEGILMLYFGRGLIAPPKLSRPGVDVLWGEVEGIFKNWRLRRANRMIVWGGADTSALPSALMGRLAIREPGVIGLPLEVREAAEALVRMGGLWEGDGCMPQLLADAVGDATALMQGLANHAAKGLPGGKTDSEGENLMLSRAARLGNDHLRLVRKVFFMHRARVAAGGGKLTRADGERLFREFRLLQPGHWQADAAALASRVFGQLREVSIASCSSSPSSSPASAGANEALTGALRVFSMADQFAKVGVHAPSHVLVHMTGMGGGDHQGDGEHSSASGARILAMLRSAAAEAGLGSQSSCTANVRCLVGDCSELFAAWLGDSEKRLRRWFAEARAASPCVLVLDGIDRFAARRSGSGEGGGDGASSVEARLVTTLLTQLDGVGGGLGQLLVVGTSRSDPKRIDEAVSRPGRLGTWTSG